MSCLKNTAVSGLPAMPKKKGQAAIADILGEDGGVEGNNDEERSNSMTCNL